MLRPFNLVFYKGGGLVGFLVKLFTKSEYSHVALAIDDKHLIQLDYRTKLSIQHFNYNKDKYDVFQITKELDDNEMEKMQVFIYQRMNTSYDWKFFFSRFFSLFLKTKITNDISTYNCDELIVDAFRHVGINLMDDKIFLTPKSLSESDLLIKREVEV